MPVCTGGCHTVFLHPLLDGRSNFPEPFLIYAVGCSFKERAPPGLLSVSSKVSTF